HPVQVAGIIAEMRLDVPSIATGLLHDTVEDTLATLEQIEETFGAEIATLVDGVTKIGQINVTSREDTQAENFRKMLIAMARYIQEVIGVLEKKLVEAGLEAEVSGRPKHFYSIYQKMQAQNLLYDQIYDLVAFRVVVDSLGECYEALGSVHANWKPVPGRFKD